MKWFECDFCNEISTEYEINKATAIKLSASRENIKGEFILIEDASDQDCFFVCPKCWNTRHIKNLKEV